MDFVRHYSRDFTLAAKRDEFSLAHAQLLMDAAAALERNFDFSHGGFGTAPKFPPHNGLANTRLICHLPLIIPPDCGFRVGNEVREWREGEAWVFDDSINHEAWNRSDRTRVILLFDIQRPEMSEQENALVSALFAAVDRYSGAPPEWDT